MEKREELDNEMRLWSSKQLEHELAEGKLSEWEKVKYMLLPLIVGAANGPIYFLTPRYGPKQPPSEFLIWLFGGVLLAVVTFYGIRLGYRANQKIDGKHFIERFTVLSVPIFIKFTVFSTPVIFLLMCAVMLLDSALPGIKGYLSPLLRIIFPIILFWMYLFVTRSIKRFGEQLERKVAGTALES